MSNTRHIAKNTLALYFRQILIMLVSLYTVRAVLETLGAEDYGIYNVVAGVVTMFGFLSTSMAYASQRYFSIEIGRNDFEQLKRVFSLTIIIYILIIVFVMLLAETIGLWFVSTKLVIPEERQNAALWVYQFSVVSFLITVLSSPYMALIISNEDMSIYANVSIIEVMLRLGVVFLLRIIKLDKLWLYGSLMCAVSVITTLSYMTACKIKYGAIKFIVYWNKRLFKEIIGFTIWSLFASSVGIFKNQLVNILLNQFFNPVVIASRGIASTVNAGVTSLSNNFIVALRPQISKNYATQEIAKMNKHIFYGAKITYFLVFVFMLPLFLEMPFVLSLWLKEIPENALLFTRLALVDALFASISYPIIDGAMATGKVKLFQIFSGGILLLGFPIAWFILLLGAQAYSVMVVGICMTVTALMARLLILRKLVPFSIIQFIKEVLFPICVVTILSSIVPVVVFISLKQSMTRLCLVTFTSVFLIPFSVYIIGINKSDRIKLREIIRSRTIIR
jgi:O-antigen/teichoic acid export membrane protein